MNNSEPAIDISERDGTFVVAVREPRVLEDQLEAMRRDVLELVEKTNKPRILFDFSGVEMICSTIIGLLIEMHRIVGAKQGEVLLANLNTNVKEVLAITRVDTLLEIHDDIENALNDQTN